MAITEERLKELIKQEAMVYRHIPRWEYNGGRVEAVKLNKNYYIDFDCGSLELCSRTGEHLSRLDDLYEHEHDAIHASKYVNTVRSE